MTATGPFELEPAELLHHDQWLRQLARSLVHGADVDDVVQDTWTAAVAQQPDRSRSLRGWLRTVLRRIAARRRRTAARRRASELRVAPDGELPSTEATVAILELQRRVLAAVSAMPEPYRSAVLLRYFHGLSNAGIAYREGIREDAVRKRIERGLEQLRKQLRDVHGADWRRSPAIAAMAGPAVIGKLSILIPGVLLMSKSMKIATAALLLVLLAAGGWWLAAPVTESMPGQLPPESVSAATASVARSESPAAAPSPEPVRVEVPAKAPVSGPTNFCAGRVFDPRGNLLGGVPLVAAETLPRVVRMSSDRAPPGVQPLTPGRSYEWNEWKGLDLAALPVVGTSAADGSFSIAAGDDSRYLFAGPGWATLRSPPLQWAQRDRLALVAAPAVGVSGDVVDDRGQPLAGVRIEVSEPPLANFPGVLENTHKVVLPICHTQPDGTFALDGLPSGAGGITFHCDGFAPSRLHVPPSTLSGQRVVLLRLGNVHMVVKGRVLDQRELPVAGALVGLGEQIVHADAEGRFQLVFQRPQDGPSVHSRLFAAHPGYQTLVLEDFGACVQDPGQRDVLLHLPGFALSIAGRVVDAAGRPRAGALVYPWNEPCLAANRTAEELGMPDDARMNSLGPGIRVFATTDVDGAFVLGGLRARDYRLHVLLQEPRAGFTSAAIAAGSDDVELRLPAELVHERIAGRCVTRDGQPVAGVMISPSLVVYVTDRGGNRYGDGLTGVCSDAEGHFELRNMPIADLLLGYSGDDIVPGSTTVDASLPLLERRIVVVRRCHLRVQVDPDRGAKVFRVLDGDGREVQVMELTPGGCTSRNRWPLQDGRSGVLSVSESATTVVLEGDTGEIVRLPLRLSTREVAVVRY